MTYSGGFTALWILGPLADCAVQSALLQEEKEAVMLYR